MDEVGCAKMWDMILFPFFSDILRMKKKKKEDLAHGFRNAVLC